MRKLLLLSLLLLSMLMLFTTACVGDDPTNTDITTPTSVDDLTPGLAEWAVILTGGEVKSTYVVGVVWVGGLDIPATDDTATLTVNGTDIEIESMFPGMWVGSCNATQGADATIKFVYNGETKVDTSLKLVNFITGSSFPSVYNPAQTANISWTLPTNNPHQIVSINATKDTAKDWSGDYSKEINVGERSFTFPANPIANAPAGATYNLGVSQVNFKIKSKIALMSINGAMSDPYVGKAKPEDMRNLAVRMLNTLTK
jgi:hypothetical protein